MDTTHAIRLSKVALVFFAGAWAALVTFGNITDPMSNYRFVEHVLAMDTTFGSDALMGRALESPVYAKLAFGLIVWMCTFSSFAPRSAILPIAVASARSMHVFAPNE